MKKNFIFLCSVFAVLLLIGPIGTIYACDTGLCGPEATQFAQAQHGPNVQVVLYESHCRTGYCESEWDFYLNGTFVGWMPCVTWDDECWYYRYGGGGGDDKCSIDWYQACPVECFQCTPAN